MVVLSGQGTAADDAAAYRGAVAKIDPHVFPSPERDAARTMLSRWCREGIAKANADSTAAWNQIVSRDDWQRFRREKLAALAKSLSRQPFEPGQPEVLVTGTIQGEGFRIENLVIQRGALQLPITANLYVPDSPRASMPGIVLSHSHHNPKHEGELQDMGMTWARAGCCVIVPNHLGHGERRQHPYRSAADFDGEFAVGRQDYYFRYDLSLQLSLVGESLMGWMVHDLMSCVDTLLTRPGVDPDRILLLGAVAGGGDPAGVTAALDERIDCVVPFNFGGPQPESRYPLPADAETTFNYAGSGSWESTRNLPRSAADGFLPWVIVGSVAPRHLIHAHEFSWDQERDPVWRRYQKIWSLEGAGDRLAFAHGQGTLTSKEPPGSHCTNIGAVHRRQIHDAFRNWFQIDVKPEDEYRNRRSREDLTCLTDEARAKLKPQPLHELLGAMTDEHLTQRRVAQSKLAPAERRRQMQAACTRLLGDTAPPERVSARPGSPPTEVVGEITVTREILATSPGIDVPIMTLSRTKYDATAKDSATPWRPLLLVVASDGIEGMLGRIDELGDLVRLGFVVALADLRGTGIGRPDSDRGAQSALTAHSATHLMLGRPLLAGQLHDLRCVWRHVGQRGDLDPKNRVIEGDGSLFSPLPADAPFRYPRRIAKRPSECDPAAPLLALLLSLYEEDAAVACEVGLLRYQTVLNDPHVQVPHAAIVPGALSEGDLPDLVASLAPQTVRLQSLVDARGRLIHIENAENAYEMAIRAYEAAGARDRLEFLERSGTSP